MPVSSQLPKQKKPKKPKKVKVATQTQTITVIENGKPTTKQIETVRYSDGSVQEL